MGIFNADITKFVNNTKLLTDNVVKEIVSEVAASVVELSPVDTGNFVSNWLVGIDTAVPWGVTGNKNPDKESNINRIISRIPVDSSNHNYLIINNTSYGEKLETGVGMKHPPYAMVGITMVRIPNIVRRVIRSQVTK